METLGDQGKQGSLKDTSIKTRIETKLIASESIGIQNKV